MDVPVGDVKPVKCEGFPRFRQRQLLCQKPGRLRQVEDVPRPTTSLQGSVNQKWKGDEEGSRDRHNRKDNESAPFHAQRFRSTNRRDLRPAYQPAVIAGFVAVE
jgi:hypothetical protein